MVSVNTDNLWVNLSIPFVSGIVGWVTNIIALRMTFLPLEFYGCVKPYLGWQGIIPAKAPKMAEKAVEIITEHIDIAAVFQQIEPGRVAQEFTPALNKILGKIITEVAEERAPTVWEFLPALAKDEIIGKACQDAPQAIEQIMQEIKENILDVFDLKHMVINSLTKDKALLNRIFLECGHKEFEFIKISGLIFGFLFGLLQMTVWFFYDEWWVLPVCGFIVGYLTNWIAMKLIFKPVKPHKICGFTIQGLFLKRQAEVSQMYAKIVSEDLINSKNIINAIITGPKSDKLYAIINRIIKKAIDDFAGISKTVIQISLGSEEYRLIKSQVAEQLIEELPRYSTMIEDYVQEALNLEKIIQDKMSSLSAKEFEAFLHPVFEEDEWKLILVGAILGLVAGFIQVGLTFI